jgi:hypothetical protein
VGVDEPSIDVDVDLVVASVWRVLVCHTLGLPHPTHSFRAVFDGDLATVEGLLSSGWSTRERLKLKDPQGNTGRAGVVSSGSAPYWVKHGESEVASLSICRYQGIVAWYATGTNFSRPPGCAPYPRFCSICAAML